MANGWTDERKAKQAALIHSWKPWTKSTGAKTLEGKSICSKNVLVGNANRTAALTIAQQELKAAEAKVMKLSRYKIIPWVDRLTRP